MTRRLPVAPSRGPLEEYAVRFDDLFRARAQRDGFRRYLEGLLLPAERNKTLTALANTEPLKGAQRKEAQSLQWFLSEAGRNPGEVKSDIAIRRHWQLVCCAFSFCWWAYGRLPIEEVAQTENNYLRPESAGRGKKETSSVVVGGAQSGEGGGWNLG
jgi:hypothetical protein